MKLNLGDLSYDAKWHTFGDGRLKIRPHVASDTNVMVKDGGVVVSGDEHWKIFRDSLEDWEKIVGDDGKPLPLTDEVKKLVFDFRLEGIPDFVVRKAIVFEQQKGIEEKNSLTGPGGSLKKTI